MSKEIIKLSGFNFGQQHQFLSNTNPMNEKTKDFKPFICIDSVGIFPFKDASILLINHAKQTQQTDHNGKTVTDLVKEKKATSWQSTRNSFPGDVRRIDPPELLTFWNEKKLNGYFQQKGETFIESLTPFLKIEDDGSFQISVNLHKILVDLEKGFKGRMLLIFRDEALHLVLEGTAKNVFLKSGNISANLTTQFPENEPVWSIQLEADFFKLLKNKNPAKLEFQVVSNRLHVKNHSTNKEQTLNLKPATSSFNFASRWNPPEEGPMIETVVTKDVMVKLRDISLNSSYKRLGLVGKSGHIQAALFGNDPNDFLILGNAIGSCTSEFQVVSHPMPMLEDDFIISIYENQILRLRSLNEDYEWMTFFEKDFSFIETTSSTIASEPTPATKVQEHLQLVPNNSKSATADIPTLQTKTRDLAKSNS
ncbi:MAG: hypothetical protein H8E38_14020 [SAR324 cluster bacterium]|nr:hypothetical protein [SAR324 cluster bacterium]MBL7035621.1 hypothetical protein [SAR324 cluster bacterium]